MEAEGVFVLSRRHLTMFENLLLVESKVFLYPICKAEFIGF